jgi:hypothetical protein
LFFFLPNANVSFKRCAALCLLKTYLHRLKSLYVILLTGKSLADSKIASQLFFVSPSIKTLLLDQVLQGWLYD